MTESEVLLCLDELSFRLHIIKKTTSDKDKINRYLTALDYVCDKLTPNDNKTKQSADTPFPGQITFDDICEE